MVPGLGMDCFLETNLFDLPHECAAHFVLWTVTIFYHLFSFPCRALGERNIFDPAILRRSIVENIAEGREVVSKAILYPAYCRGRYNVGVVSGTRINSSFRNLLQFSMVSKVLGQKWI